MLTQLQLTNISIYRVPSLLLRSYQIISPCLRHQFMSLNIIRLYDEMLAPRPTPKFEEAPFRLSATVFPPYWRPFLHPQPEDAPCHGDKAHLSCGNSHIPKIIWRRFRLSEFTHIRGKNAGYREQNSLTLLTKSEVTKSK